MRRLIPIFALPIALLACGSASPQPVARDSRERACSRIELNRVEAPVSGGGATVDWEVASTVDVRGFLVEQKLAGGRWKRSASAPASARSVR